MARASSSTASFEVFSDAFIGFRAPDFCHNDLVRALAMTHDGGLGTRSIRV